MSKAGRYGGTYAHKDIAFEFGMWISPKFAELNDDILFGEIWSRESELSLKNRSMITISALMAQCLFPQLKSHFIIGKKHGITKQEAVEIVTQLAFYSGWAKAWNAFPLIEEVYGTEDEEIEKHGGVFGIGEPNVNFAQYFIGNSYLKPLTDPNETKVFIANVTLCPNSEVEKGMNIVFESYSDKLITKEQDIDNWISIL